VEWIWTLKTPTKRGGFFYGRTHVTGYISHDDAQGISISKIEWHREREPDDPPFKPPHEPDEGDWETMPNGTMIWTRRDSSKA
jgi:hypothetical protein